MKTIREITLEVLTELGQEHGIPNPKQAAIEAMIVGDITYAGSMPDKDVPKWVVPDEILPAFKEWAKSYFEKRINWKQARINWNDAL